MTDPNQRGVRRDRPPPSAPILTRADPLVEGSIAIRGDALEGYGSSWLTLICEIGIVAFSADRVAQTAAEAVTPQLSRTTCERELACQGSFSATPSKMSSAG
jgi:hypothetical protein